MTNKKKKTGPEKTHTLCSKGAKVMKPYKPVLKKRTILESSLKNASTSSRHQNMLTELKLQL